MSFDTSFCNNSINFINTAVLSLTSCLELTLSGLLFLPKIKREQIRGEKNASEQKWLEAWLCWFVSNLIYASLNQQILSKIEKVSVQSPCGYSWILRIVLNENFRQYPSPRKYWKTRTSLNTLNIGQSFSDDLVKRFQQ